jgi:hypothetical protein
MKMSTKTILLTSIALFTAGALQAQIILYSDNFNGSAVNLNGAAPDISVTNVTHGTGGNWTATTGILQNGTLPTGGSNTASLAFKPVDGYLYTLTMTTNFADGLGYVGVGFAGLNNTTALGANSADGGILWSLTRPLRTSDSVRQEAHADSTGGTGLLSPTGSSTVNPSTISVVLDTRDGTGLWDVQYLVGGSALTSFANIGVAYENKINAVKFSNVSNTGLSNTMQSFQLTVIPEPSTWLLLTGSLTALVILRRRRAS